VRVKVLPIPGPTDDQAAALDRSADARLARVHLRGGLLPLARAALEQMAGAATLDADAMSDLAEVRWRSGDTEGAAEAARAHQASGGDEPMAALIIAEEFARLGQGEQAARTAKSVDERVGGAIDMLFADQPRSSVWPAPDDGWMDLDASAPGRWGILVGGSEVGGPSPDTWTNAPLRATEPAMVASTAAVLRGRGGVEHPGGQTNTAAVVMSGRLAGEELQSVDRSLAAGETAAATDRLAVLLRLDPALAPVILSAADKAIANAEPGSASASAVHLVRGDAYRILGREIESAAAYQQAHQALAKGSEPEESP
jgi:hypothetical protein